MANQRRRPVMVANSIADGIIYGPVIGNAP
jgi:hypothetical protein